jgi:hypothetical protein
MRRAYAVPLLFLLLSQCSRLPDDAKAAGGAAGETAQVVADATVARSFDAAGITTVVLRAANAAQATVRHTSAGTVEVSGKARGGAGGYHSPDPNWKETKPEQWGLDFVGKRHQDVLVISSKNEIQYIHHGYSLDSLELSVPDGVKVIPVARQLSENGQADLSPPP